MPGAGWLGYAGSAFFFSLGSVFLLAILFPHRFVKGVRETEDEFELWRPLRRTLHVRYAEVRKILAVSRGGGEVNDELTDVIQIGRSGFSIEHVDFYDSGLCARISGLPGFNEPALREATHHDATILQTFVGKKFVIYCGQGAGPSHKTLR
jgi:hypothetical protein